MSKTFELVRPLSLVDENYAEYEYLIRWVGRDGAEYEWMFYDAEIQHKITGNVINQEDDNMIESLIQAEERMISLTAEDLSKNDLSIIGQLFANKFVQRIKKDGAVERYAPDRNSYKYRLLSGRYKVEFTLQMTDLREWR